MMRGSGEDTIGESVLVSGTINFVNNSPEASIDDFKYQTFQIKLYYVF